MASTTGPADSWPLVPPGLPAEVELIVASVLRPDEIDRVEVGWATSEGSWPEALGDATDGQTMLVARVVARGETYHCPLWQSDWPSLREGLDAFADQLEDFIAESRFAWGQQRLVPRPWA